MDNHFRGCEYVYLINNRNELKHDKLAFLGPVEILKVDYEHHNIEICFENLVKVVHMNLIKRAHFARMPGNIIEKPTKLNWY